MRHYLIVVLITIAGCQFNDDNTKNTVSHQIADTCFFYPSVVDSLKTKDLYDSARWYIYTWNCDHKYLPKSDTSKSITYGELPLRFNSLSFKHDTLNFIFDFMDGNQTILLSMTRDTKESSTGVGFNIKTRAKIYMMYEHMIMTAQGSTSRYANPLQPEVLAYIKSNWEKLNGCFKELAERKRITK